MIHRLPYKIVSLNSNGASEESSATSTMLKIFNSDRVEIATGVIGLRCIINDK